MGRYDNRDYGYGVDYRQVSLRPQWNGQGSLDPNYRDGGYGGVRMEPGTRGQAAYGWMRQAHASDLDRFGGFAGRYGGHRGGGFDRDGIFRDPFDEMHPTNLGQPHRPMPLRRGTGYDRHYPMRGGPAGPGRPREFENRQDSDGGVRDDARFVRQYNRNSVSLRTGHAYDRGYGWADDRPDPRRDDPRGDRTHEHGHQGYNSAGWSDKQLPSSGRPGGR